MRCGDTVLVKLNRRLTSDTSATGDFVYLRKFDTAVFNTLDSTYERLYDTIEVETSLHPLDSSIIRVIPIS